MTRDALDWQEAAERAVHGGAGLSDLWSEEEVRARIADAIDTLRRLPFPRNGAPPDHKVQWPDIVRSFWEAYGTASTKVTRVRPTAEAIDRMEDVLPWLFWVGDRKRRHVVMLRALGLGWRKIGCIVACSHETARYWERNAVRHIADVLNLTQARFDKSGLF